MSLLIGLCMLLALHSVTAIKFSNKCELAKALEQCGMEKDLLSNYVCLVYSESGGNSSAVGGPNTNGSFDYGLFQINGKWWCSLGKPGGDCNIDCNKLIDDDLTDDCICARKIYKRHKFTAWNGWKKRCQDKPLPNLNNCIL